MRTWLRLKVAGGIRNWAPGIKTDYVISIFSFPASFAYLVGLRRGLSWSLSSRAIKDGDSGGEQTGAEHGDAAQKQTRNSATTRWR